MFGGDSQFLISVVIGLLWSIQTTCIGYILIFYLLHECYIASRIKMFGVSTTGISGPDGGTEEKPVGTVCVALARNGAETHVERFVFPLDRIRHRTLTAQVALDWVRRSLLGVELVGPSLLRRRGGAAPPVPTGPQPPRGAK